MTFEGDTKQQSNCSDARTQPDPDAKARMMDEVHIDDARRLLDWGENNFGRYDYNGDHRLNRGEVYTGMRTAPTDLDRQMLSELAGEYDQLKKQNSDLFGHLDSISIDDLRKNVEVQQHDAQQHEAARQDLARLHAEQNASRDLMAPLLRSPDGNPYHTLFRYLDDIQGGGPDGRISKGDCQEFLSEYDRHARTGESDTPLFNMANRRFVQYLVDNWDGHDVQRLRSNYDAAGHQKQVTWFITTDSLPKAGGFANLGQALDAFEVPPPPPAPPVVEAPPAPPAPVVEAPLAPPAPVVEAPPAPPAPAVEAPPAPPAPVVEAPPTPPAPVVEAPPAPPAPVVEAPPAPPSAPTVVLTSPIDGNTPWRTWPAAAPTPPVETQEIPASSGPSCPQPNAAQAPDLPPSSSDAVPPAPPASYTYSAPPSVYNYSPPAPTYTYPCPQPENDVPRIVDPHAAERAQDISNLYAAEDVLAWAKGNVRRFDLDDNGRLNYAELDFGIRSSNNPIDRSMLGYMRDRYDQLKHQNPGFLGIRDDSIGMDDLKRNLQIQEKRYQQDSLELAEEQRFQQ